MPGHRQLYDLRPERHRRISPTRKLPQIAISVDMLDTGIDVPEVLNLGFQEGHEQGQVLADDRRGGHRRCPGLIDGANKDKFYIFDCGNFGVLPHEQEAYGEQDASGCDFSASV